MPSVGQRIADVESAREAVDKPTVRHALSTTKHVELCRFLRSDSYAFTYIVCGHHNLVPEVHMPLSYAATGSAERLMWALTSSGFEGYVIDEFRRAFQQREIDLWDGSEVLRVTKALEWVNFRYPRGSFKSSVVTHGGATFTITNDPNSTNKITTAIDDKAWELCDQIGKTILSGRYRDLFPERIPERPDHNVTESAINLGGRTISHPQPTLTAFGYLTKDIGGHYDTFWTDDLVVGGKNGNATPTLLPGVKTWLSGMSGYFMLTRNVRRVHVGTRWDEDDDHTYLTRGRRAAQCLSVFVPIEVHEGEVVNIMERGNPTMPSFLPKEKIQQLQDAVLADEREAEPAMMWRCNYLLNPGIGGGRMFSPVIVNDPDRCWMGPFEHPKARNPKTAKQYENRFLVARFDRDEEGRIVGKDNQALDLRDEQWRKRAKVLRYDPWADLDRVLTLDPSWAAGGDNWAVTAAAVDPWLVKFQLETQADTTGMDGWIEALAEMADFYKPRVIGFDRGGYQDPVVQNLLKTDKRLRRIRSIIVPVHHNNIAKKARIRAGVSEPLKMYKWLLLPGSTAEAGDYGAQATRDEMLAYKGDPKAVDGILDSLAMVDAVSRRMSTPDERDRAKKDALRRSADRRRMIDPALGVPMEGLYAA